MSENQNDKNPDGDFDDEDLTDGREVFHWESRYSKKALFWIIFDFSYLGICIVTSLLLSVICYLKVIPNYYNIDNNLLENLEPYWIAFLAGGFGGSLYGVKWTYHCVAIGRWHSDRRAWRIFVPLIGASFALIFSILLLSNFINVLNNELLQSRKSIFAIGFLSGYFSDKAAAKLVEVSKSIFGVATKD